MKNLPEFPKKNMKKAFFLFCVLFLGGCGSEEIISSPLYPPAIFLSDSTGQEVGIAVPLRENIFVTADHLREKFGDLFWNDQRTEVFARDFENNVLFLTLEDWSGMQADWQDVPPAVGEDVFWIDFDSSKESGAPVLVHEKVQALPRLIAGNDTQEQMLLLSGTADLQNSGSPVFGESGRVLGILVGGNKEKNLSYAVRGDIIIDILKEHLE